MTLNPYLFFNGQCESAFKFYAQCLGGKIEMMLTYAESPTPQPEEMRSRIMHARIAAGDVAIMGSDAPPGMYEPMKGFAVSLNLSKVPEAERIFNALADGGTVRMPFGKTFWAEGFGMLIDKFGTPWMINCEQTA